MLKLLKLLLLLTVILAIVGFLVPKDYKVEKSITIVAPIQRIHALVGDLTRWPEWAPWTEHDPTLVTTLGGQTTGVGASQTWTSDNGDGELTLTKSSVDSGITYDMAFIMEDTRVPAVGTMSYAPAEGGGTTVTWTMEGSWEGAMPPVIDGLMKLMSPWMIGGEFQSGLDELKRIVEASS